MTALQDWLKEAAREVGYKGELPEVVEIEQKEDRGVVAALLWGKTSRTHPRLLVRKGIDKKEAMIDFKHELVHLKQGRGKFVMRGKIRRRPPKELVERELEAKLLAEGRGKYTISNLHEIILELVYSQGYGKRESYEAFREVALSKGLSPSVVTRAIHLAKGHMLLQDEGRLDEEGNLIEPSLKKAESLTEKEERSSGKMQAIKDSTIVKEHLRRTAGGKATTVRRHFRRLSR